MRNFNWFSSLLSIASLVDNLRQLFKDVKVTRENRYIYITSNAFEITVFIKDDNLASFADALINFVSSRGKPSQ